MVVKSSNESSLFTAAVHEAVGNSEGEITIHCIEGCFGRKYSSYNRCSLIRRNDLFSVNFRTGVSVFCGLRLSSLFLQKPLLAICPDTFCCRSNRTHNRPKRSLVVFSQDSFHTAHSNILLDAVPDSSLCNSSSAIPCMPYCALMNSKPNNNCAIS